MAPHLLRFLLILRRSDRSAWLAVRVDDVCDVRIRIERQVEHEDDEPPHDHESDESPQGLVRAIAAKSETGAIPRG